MNYTFSDKGLTADERTLCKQFEKQYFDNEVIDLSFIEKAIKVSGVKKEAFKVWDYWRMVNGRFVQFRESLREPMELYDLIMDCQAGDAGAMWFKDGKTGYARLRSSAKNRDIGWGWHPYLSIINGSLFVKYNTIIGGYKIAKIK